MTDSEVAAALGRILEADDVLALTSLAAEIRRAHPSDPEADVVARQAELKGRRLIQEA